MFKKKLLANYTYFTKMKSIASWRSSKWLVPPLFNEVQSSICAKFIFF